MADAAGGIRHKTTLQTARERLQTNQATPLIGQKRSYEAAQMQSSSLAASGSRNHHFRPASALPEQPRRLTPSAVKAVGTPLGPEVTEYSQRRAVSSTPAAASDPLLRLSHPRYGLPQPLIDNLSSMGIKTIYPWQKQCLLGPGLLGGEKSLVYSAPTGGGKSLVADVLMLKRVLQDREAKALLVLPFVALVQEKSRWLRNVVQGISRAALAGREADHDDGSANVWRRRADADTVRVVPFFGGAKIRATWHDFDIAVCTIEKANALVNTAIDDCTITSLKVVVLDEIHLVDDGQRGYLLELMATKILCLDHNVQLVGMSATLKNIDLLAKWLEAHSYKTHYRPVPIEEHIVANGNIYAAFPPEEKAPQSTTTAAAVAAAAAATTTTQGGPGTPIRTIEASPHKELQETVLNSVVALACETALAGYGALVFASSRAVCESDALLISRAMPAAHELDPLILEKRLDLLNDLRSLSVGLDATLEQTIPAGVAFHHAGITTEERDLIAGGYDAGVIKVCVATSSLAAGINLPARRVILHSARMGRELVGPSMLRQMRGRAGRKGKDEVGETYLCCRASDLDPVLDLMRADLPLISSCLVTDKRRVQRALLEAIAVRLATSRASLDEYMRKTLLCCCSSSAGGAAAADSIEATVESSLRDLQDMGFVTRDDFSDYQASQLGKAIVVSALDPEDGIFIHRELERALKAFVLDGEMHVLYTFTPVHDFSMTIDWRVFWNEMENLDESGLRVMGFLGLKPTLITKMFHGDTMKESTPEEKETARIYHRFYLALQLRDLCNEMPVHRVAQKYKVPRGAVQTLAQTCQGFAAGMIKFCQQMGWGIMAAALDHFSDRLKAGAKSDLLALAKITFIKSRTARVFWENGFRTVAVVANAEPTELVPVLLQAQPNKVRLEQRDEHKYKEKLLAKAKVITESANRLWQMEMQYFDEE